MAQECSPGQKTVSISISEEALKKIDARAAQLELSRSAYLKLLASHDVDKTTPLALPQSVATPPSPLDLTSEVYQFLLIAVPALQEREARKNTPEAATPSAITPPDDAAQNTLWQFFLLEMDEILRHKYLRSKELRYDIGLSRAVQEWLQNHRALWAKAHPIAG